MKLLDWFSKPITVEDCRRWGKVWWTLWLIVILGAVVVILASCVDPWEGTGKLERKEYDDPDSWTIPGYWSGGYRTCSGGYNNQPQICTETPRIYHPPITFHDDERFIFVVRDEHDKTHSLTVPEMLWTTCQIGQWYSTDTKACT